MQLMKGRFWPQIMKAVLELSTYQETIKQTNYFSPYRTISASTLDNLTLLCMPSVLHFSKVRYLFIKRQCLLLQKIVLRSLKDICMIVDLNLNEFALRNLWAPDGLILSGLPISICYPVVLSIYP